MKKGVLLNSAISAVVARMGHTDQITIGDAGLRSVGQRTQGREDKLCFARNTSCQKMSVAAKLQSVARTRDFSPEFHSSPGRI